METTSKFPFILAQTSLSRPTIEVSAEFVLQNIYFADLAIVTKHFDDYWAHCGFSYLIYVKKQFFEMVQDRLRGYRGSAILPPEQFAVVRGGACEGLSQVIPIPSAFRNERNAFVTNALGFIYLHELGHHVLRHRESEVRGLNLNDREDLYVLFKTMCMSRRQCACLGGNVHVEAAIKTSRQFRS